MHSVLSLLLAALVAMPLLSTAVPLRQTRAAAAGDLTVLSACRFPVFFDKRRHHPRFCQRAGETRDRVLYTGPGKVPGIRL